MKRTLALLLVVVLTAALFVGCSPVGKYHIKTIDGKKPLNYTKDLFEDEIADNYDGDFEDWLDEMDASEKDLKDPIILTLSKDGKYEVENFEGDTISKGKWEKDGNKIKFKPKNGDNFKADYKGGKIIIDGDDIGYDGDVVFGK